MGFEDALRDVAFTIVRFMAFSAHAIVFGLPLILLLVLRPAFAGLDERWDDGRRRLARRLEGVTRAALMASAVATAIGLLLQAVLVASLRATDVDSLSFESAFGTTFGQWYLLRFPVLTGLYVLLIGQIARRALARTRVHRPWWFAWIGLGAVLIATSSFTGHAAVAQPLALALGTDVVHLAAGAVWFSGIVLLAIYLPDAWRARAEADRLQLLAPAVTRFSMVALVAITLVAVTGVLNSLFNVAALDDLIDSSYGIALSFKLLLFAGVLTLGAVNHFVLRQRLRAPASSGPPAQRVFRKTIAVELALGIGIMAATGLLTGQAKTREGPLFENEPAQNVSSESRP